MKTSIKISLLTLVLLLGVTSIQPALAAPQPSASSLEASAPIFGAKRYKKRRIQRQNTVGKTNQRNKGLLRKNGIGQVFHLENTMTEKGGMTA
jgi:hypothetical protein